MFDISQTNDTILLLVFPGLIFLVLGSLLWAVLTHLILTSLEEHPKAGLRHTLNHLFSFPAKTVLYPSYGMPWLVLRVFFWFIFYLLLLTSLVLPDLPDSFLLLVWAGLGASVMGLGYELATPTVVRVGRSFAFYELLVMLGLGLWTYALTEGSFTSLREDPWSNNPSILLGQLLLFLSILLFVGRSSSYLGMVRPTRFNLTPEELSWEASHDASTPEIERKLLWLSETLGQVGMTLLLTLMVGNGILEVVTGTNRPVWLYLFTLLITWIVLSAITFGMAVLTTRARTTRLDPTLRWLVLLAFLVLVGALLQFF